MKYIVVSAIKKLISDSGKRSSPAFMSALDEHVESLITKAINCHNGGKKTLDLEVATYCGIRKP